MIWTLLKVEFITIQMKTTVQKKITDTKQTKFNLSSGIVNSMSPCVPLKKQYLG